MLIYLLLIVGIIIVFKKEVKITSERKIEGKNAQYIGGAIFLSGLIGIFSSILGFIGLIAVIGLAIYLITSDKFKTLEADTIVASKVMDDSRKRKKLFN